MHTSRICSFATAMALSAGLSQMHALESELQLGPQDARLSAGLLDKHLVEGALRSDDVALGGLARGRYENIGLGIRSVLAIGDDDQRDVDHGDLLEVDLWADYLITIPDYAQIIPRYRTSFFPYDDDADEPHWLGVDGWYLLPYEGLEVGASIEADLVGDWGWLGEIGARQLVQDVDTSLDLRFWQLIGIASADFHEQTTGAASGGFTTLELGAQASAPLPWEATWVHLRLETHWWLESGRPRSPRRQRRACPQRWHRLPPYLVVTVA